MLLSNKQTSFVFVSACVIFCWQRALSSPGKTAGRTSRLKLFEIKDSRGV